MLAACLLCLPIAHAQAPSGAHNELVRKYSDLLLLQAGDYSSVQVGEGLLSDALAPQFQSAMKKVGSYPFDRPGELVKFVIKFDAETELTDAQREDEEAHEAFLNLFSRTMPLLAYAYNTPGTGAVQNPYFQNESVAQAYIRALEYCYGRGITEDAWLPDHAGRASAQALALGLVRRSGDLSTVSLRLGGFIQSVFLMREPLSKAGLLDKYRAVVRNLVVNHGALYHAFFPYARRDAGIKYEFPLPVEEWHYLNADGVRLFVDFFWPYFMLVEDETERRRMSAVLWRVIATNMAVKPGVQGTIKPDGTAFHHLTAYMGAYGPFTLESFAQLLYLAKGVGCYAQENVDAVKLAVESYRVMIQKYSSSPALQGRFPRGNDSRAAAAISKAMALLGHLEGPGDSQMKARFLEFFDERQLSEAEAGRPFYAGSRGVPIRGLGIYRLISELRSSGGAAAETPSGV